MKTPLEEMMDRIELQRLEDEYDLKKINELLNRFLILLDEIGLEEEFVAMMEEDFEFWENMVDARNESKEK